MKFNLNILAGILLFRAYFHLTFRLLFVLAVYVYYMHILSVRELEILSFLRCTSFD